MGGYSIDQSFDGALSQAEVTNALNRLKSDHAHEMGHGRGLHGIHFQFVTNPRLRTVEDVRTTYDNLEKCEGVIAKVTTSDLPWKERGPLKVYEDAARDAAKALSGHAAEILARTVAQKSQTRGCGTCGSAIAVAYLKPTQRRADWNQTTLACPVCLTEDLILTQADEKRRETLTAALTKAQDALASAERDLAAAHTKTVWFAYGYARD